MNSASAWPEYGLSESATPPNALERKATSHLPSDVDTTHATRPGPGRAAPKSAKTATMQLDLGLVRAAPKSAKTAKTNATRPRPGPGGAEIRKDR